MKCHNQKSVIGVQLTVRVGTLVNTTLTNTPVTFGGTDKVTAYKDISSWKYEDIGTLKNTLKIILNKLKVIRN